MDHMTHTLIMFFFLVVDEAWEWSESTHLLHFFVVLASFIFFWAQVEEQIDVSQPFTKLGLATNWFNI